ncbi:MAG: hypothetical protein DYH05_10825 [Acidobacteria bacterium ACB1]|nr:hypothetical protein [Pyrinomonadaceae bacterium]MCE7962975.1 hypothetical protein [Acidobacteria bacterium ACB1]RIJ95735.1 MAG: hypothetical protein DCC44_01770 [Acidobacteriota bacterium]
MLMWKDQLIRLVMLGAATLAAVSIGCGGIGESGSTANTAVSKNANVGSTNANTSNTATASPSSTPTPGVSQATPSDTYRTAYEFRKNKDVEGLKKVLSPDALDFLKMLGEANKPKRSLDEMISDMFETKQADKAEVRNEVINGDRASLEYLTDEGTWETMDFDKIDGKWFIGFPKNDKPSDTDDDKK